MFSYHASKNHFLLGFQVNGSAWASMLCAVWDNITCLSSDPIRSYLFIIYDLICVVCSFSWENKIPGIMATYNPILSHWLQKLCVPTWIPITLWTASMFSWKLWHVLSSSKPGRRNILLVHGSVQPKLFKGPTSRMVESHMQICFLQNELWKERGATPPLCIIHTSFCFLSFQMTILIPADMWQSLLAKLVSTLKKLLSEVLNS